jgi:Xaa-Pro aminopeptidase
MDFGARYAGYCSDMTRTVAIGEVSDRQRYVYETVLKAQEMSANAVKAGAVCKEVDAIARDYIYANGFEGCFGHGLGHSLGLEIHENPAFNTRDESKVESGMIMTVEPGIYLENEFGVRIEDMVLVTDDGYENLTHSPKELIIL